MGNTESSTPGGGSSSAAASLTGASVGQKICPVSNEGGSKCPFGFGGDSSTPASSVSLGNAPGPECPVNQQVRATNETPGAEGCPVRRKGGTYVNKEQFNVYSQKINPSNNMPSLANQEMAPGQKQLLSVDRVQSQIPKGGTESSTWLYPSPQMFWNAIVRKNKLGDADEEIQHIETVVAIHNNMNEKTWKQILSWEKLHDEFHHSDGTEPKLLRFIGRPDEMTPKAKLRSILGQPEPFDRHDWTVDRGGKLVRYVIDYYFDEEAAGNDTVPKNMSDAGAVRSIRVDARPALDSAHAVLDQFLYMPIQILMGKTEYNPPPLFSNTNHLASLQNLLVLTPAPTPAAKLDKEELMERSWGAIQQQCESAKQQLAECAGSTDEEACRGAKSIALQRCTASVICPALSKAFDDAVHAAVTEDSLDHISKAYGDMTTCLDDFYEQSKDYLSDRQPQKNGKM